MTHLLLMSAFALCGQSLHGWSAESTTIVESKQSVNFYGELHTQQGNKQAINNISVAGKLRQIPVYERPKEKGEGVTQTSKKSGGDKTYVPLTVDPKSELVTTNIDLSEIKTLHVPYPNQIWVYQKDQNGRKIKYVEIETENKSGEKTTYLIEKRTKIYCHGKSESGPQEKKVPILAVKTLFIHGHTSHNEKTANTTPSKIPTIAPQP